jgi:hypothetical protein
MALKVQFESALGGRDCMRLWISVRRVCEQVVIVGVWELQEFQKLQKLQSRRCQIKSLTHQDLTTSGRQTTY